MILIYSIQSQETVEIAKKIHHGGYGWESICLKNNKLITKYDIYWNNNYIRFSKNYYRNTHWQLIVNAPISAIDQYCYNKQVKTNIYNHTLRYRKLMAFV